MPGVIAEAVEYPISEGTFCTAEEGKTRQSDAQAADINLTIKKYNLQPDQLVPGWSGQGVFGDYTVLPSYQEALNNVAVARESFRQLPAEVRGAFENNPAVMLDAWENGLREDLFIRIGWLEAPAEAPVVPEPAPAP